MIKKVCSVFGGISYKIKNLIERCENQYLLHKIENRGECHIGTNFTITHPQNLVLGNKVSIGDNCLFMCAKAKIIMGNHIMLAPNVSIVTGNHRVNQIGVYMDSVTEKLEENDMPVIIEDDVWIGMNVTILKGVTIGRGSVIGAGSIIVKDVPPYSICYPEATVPKRNRFTEQEIIRHEQLIKQIKN